MNFVKLTIAQNPGFGTLGRFCPPHECYAPSTIGFWGLYASNWWYKTFLNRSLQSETSKWSLDCQNHSDLRFFSRFSGQMYQMPYRIWQKYCLIFAFKPPLIHLELQNTPQTLSGCITREYYRFWEFQHHRSTRTGLTVVKLLRRDFSGAKGLQLSTDQICPVSRQCNFITISPVLVLRLWWNSQKR